MCTYFLSLNVPRNWRNQLKIRVLFHVVPLDLHRCVWESIAFHTENLAPPAVCASLTMDAYELFAHVRLLRLSADMLPQIQTVAYGMRFSQQVQDSSLRIHKNQNALRSLCYSCVIMDRTLSSPRSTVSKKVMFHGLYNLDKEFLSDLSPDKASCPACVLVWETGFENSHKYSSHFGSARFCMAHWPGSCQDYKKQKSFSHHDHFECSRGAVQ